MLSFDQKQLKLATIASYMAAIADYLGSDGSIVSQSRELNRLIASFIGISLVKTELFPLGTYL